MKKRLDKISIAMATYNGKVYLEEQFQSLFAQTRQPDEVVVYDDASSDNTLSLLTDLQSRAPFRIEIISGTSNLHVNRSFVSSLENCVGDFVFFCDQDDIWEPEKIARFMDVFERDSNIGFVFSDASQIDAQSKPLEGSLWQSVGFMNRRQRRFRQNSLGEMLEGGNFIYGMAAAFRKDCLLPFCPIRAHPNGMTHDTWFAMHALATGWEGHFLNEKTVRYRRHAHQTTKKENVVKSADSSERIRKRHQQATALIEALEYVRDGVAKHAEVRSKALLQLDHKIAHLQMRERLRERRSPVMAIRAASSPGYWKYARGPYSALRDFLGL